MWFHKKRNRFSGENLSEQPGMPEKVLSGCCPSSEELPQTANGRGGVGEVRWGGTGGLEGMQGLSEIVG